MGQTTCPHCGALLSPGYQFCIMCGRSLSQEPAPVTYQPGGYAETQVIQQPLPVVPSPAHSQWESGVRPVPGRPVRLAPPMQEARLDLSAVPGEDVSGGAPFEPAAMAPDAPTTVFGQDDLDEMDAATTVIDFGPHLWLVRRSTGERIELDLPAVVGKGSQATARISGNSAISRTHVRIEEALDGYVAEDLGSTNRTSVNGARVMPSTKTPLASGDVLRLADEDFEFQVEQ